MRVFLLKNQEEFCIAKCHKIGKNSENDQKRAFFGSKRALFGDNVRFGLFGAKKGRFLGSRSSENSREKRVKKEVKMT